MQSSAPVQSDESPRGATLLCVDDEEAILTSLTRVFRPLDYRVLTAGNGQHALEILESETVDLVIADMRMPGMSGVELLEKVAEHWPGTIRMLMTGYNDLDQTVDAINKAQIYHYVNKPWSVNDIRTCVQRAVERKYLEEERGALLETIQRQHAEVVDLNTNLEQKVRDRVKEIERMKTLLEKVNRELKKNIVDSIGIFSSIIETREGTVAGHSRRVADHTRKIAVDMGMGEVQAQGLLFAALLHDIGKVSLPDYLIKRPFDALTHDERAEVVKHPVIGEAMLMSLDVMKEVAGIIRSHHELYDGSGYPDGLVGEAIPLGARILVITNEYDMLTSGRLRIDRLSESEARSYLYEHRSTRYDPEIIDRFLAILQRQVLTTPVQEAVIGPDQLRPGMRLARDMVTKNGTVILPKGHVLDQQLIMKIRALARNTGAQIRINVVRS